MTIKPFTIDELVSIINGDGYPPNRKGRDLIHLFNRYGARDIYDEYGLPDIGKRNGQRPSRKEYTKFGLQKLLGTHNLRELLHRVFNELEDKEGTVDKLNEILNPDGYQVSLHGNQLTIQGGVIDRRQPVVNEAHFQEIQNRIISALDDSKVSIRVVMAWFTNEMLFNKLVEKYKKGVDVRVAIYDDGINRKHGINIAQVPHDLLRRGQKGGLMHDKFCVIDNQVVVTGSYNWTDNAEFRNDENITVEKDPEQATRYSQEYRRLTNVRK